MRGRYFQFESFFFFLRLHAAEYLSEYQVCGKLRVSFACAGVEKVGYPLVFDDKVGFRHAEPVFFYVTLLERVGKFRHRRAYRLHEFVGYLYRQYVRLGEIPVVLRVLFTAHAFGGLGTLVIASGFLNDLFSAVQYVALTRVFVGKRFLHEGERVHILDLRARAERLAFLMHRDIDVATHAAFLHLAVGYPDMAHGYLKLLHIFARFGYVRNVGFGHYLDERHAAAVIVDIGVAVLVNELSRVLFDVDMVYPYALAARELNVAAHAYRLVELRDLICLRKVGIDVVLAVEVGDFTYPAISGEPRAYGVGEHLLIQYGKASRLSRAHRATMGVRLRAECGGTGAEYLGLGL